MPGMLQPAGFGVPGMMAPPPAGLDFSGLLNQMQATNLGGGAAQQQQQQQQQHPADRFRIQLQSLRDMGFDDEQGSLRALQASHGNLNRAVDMMLMGEVPASVPGIPDAVAPPAPSNNNAPSEPESAEPKDNTEKKND